MFDIRDLETIAEMTDAVNSYQTGSWTIKNIEFNIMEINEQTYIKTDGYDYHHVYNGVEIWEYINYVFN